MNDSISVINKEIQIVREKYLRSAIDLISDYRNEDTTRNEYRGRQIFELLQNADDCYKDECPEINVKIELKDGILIIQNTGIPFSTRGIISLMHPDASSKREGTIGCRGLGFRSVLNWSKRILINTNDFCVEFSEEEAQRQMVYYKENCDKDHVDELKYMDRTAILSSAIVRKPDENAKKWLDDGYATSIVLYCLPECIDTIQNQLTEFQFEELLFLKHIRNITIRSPKAERNIDTVEENGEVLIQDGDKYSAWTCWSKTGELPQNDGKNKKYEIILAYNNDAQERESIRQNGVLYSYFKTVIPMPFPFLVHGTFDLTRERNCIDKENANNEALLGILIDFIAEKAEFIAEKDSYFSYDALKFVLPASVPYELDRDYGFSALLKEKIKDYRLFPTINNEFKRISDGLFYEDKFRFEKIVEPSTFSTLLKYCEDDAVRKYLYDVSIKFYKDAEMADMLDKDADTYVERGQNAALLEMFFDYYRSPSKAPQIIVDNHGTRICGNSVPVIFNNPSKLFDLPVWGDMCFIDSQLENELKTHWNCTPRALMEKLTICHCQEYSFDRVLRVLISQVKEDKDKTQGLLSWLFLYWNTNGQQFETSLSNVEVRTISRSGEIVFCSKTYFGQDYANEIGEKILSYYANTVYLANIKEIGLAEYDLSIVKSFLSQLGVKEFPPIVASELERLEMNEYVKYNAEIYTSLNATYNGIIEQYNHEQLFAQWEKSIKVANIHHIDEILRNATTIEILTWILSDKSLYNHLVEKNEIDDYSTMIGKPQNKVDFRKVYKSQMRSWLRKKFTDIEWLSTKSGRKVNCSECTRDDNKLSPIVEVVNVDISSLSNIFHRPMRKEVDLLLENLGVADDIVNLPKEKIYEILLRLPEIDSDCRIGRQVYTALNLFYNSDDVNRLINNNKQYELFKREGKVLSRRNGMPMYMPVNEVYYVGKKIYSDDILNNYNKLELQRKAGDEKIAKMFCVKPIQTIGEVKIDFTEHRINTDYQSEYKRLLPYLYAKRMSSDVKNRDLNLLRESQIMLVKEAKTIFEVDGEKRIGVLKDYEMIYKSKTAYIKIPDSIHIVEELKKQIKFCSAVAEMLTTLFNVDGDKDAFMLILSQNSSYEIEGYFKENGDESLSVVNMAKEKFASTLDNKAEFWKAIAHSVGIDAYTAEIRYGDNLPAEFNYADLNNSNQAHDLILLFKSIGIDISNYNETAFVPIDLRGYFRNEFKALQQRLRNKYLYYCCNQIIANNGTQKEFRSKQHAFDFYEPVFENSVSSDIELTFEENFGIKCEDLDKMGTEYQALLISLKNDDIDVNNDNQLNNDPSNMTTSIDYRGLFQSIGDETQTSTQKPTISSDSEGHTSKGGGKNKNGGVYDTRANRKKEEDGFMAECKVFHTLKNRYGTNGSIEWISGNGEYAGFGPGDDSKGYDIKYSDENCETHYVEVKGTSTNNLEFTLSRNEYRFAIEHRECYELWFVFIRNGVADVPCELGNIFVFDEGESLFDNHRFIIESNEYRFKARIMQED